MYEDALTALLWAPGFLLGLALIALAVAVLVLLRILRRARNAASYAEADPDDPLGEYELGGSEGHAELKVADLRASVRKGDLARVFRRVEKLTEQPGSETAGRLPWFLCLGSAAAGKSTLLGHSDLRLPYGEPPAPAPDEPAPSCRLWIFDSAVVVDVEGDLVLPPSGVAVDRAGWLSLLKAQRARERGRPGDGIVLVLPADELEATRDDPTAQRVMARRADRLRRCMEQAQRTFGLRLPVWVVISRFDLLPGVSDLLSTLDETRRREIFGWSNPHSATTAYSGAWADDAIDTVAGTLQDHQVRVMAARTPDSPPFANRAAFLALPGTVATLARPLHTVLGRIFSGGPSLTAPPLRGIYFTAGTGFDEPLPESSHDFASGAVPGTVAPLAAGGHRDVAFVTDLLSEKVFGEWDLAQPEPAISEHRSRLASMARAAALALLVIGLLLLTWSGWRTMDRVRLLADGFVHPAQRALDCPRQDCLQPAVETLLAGGDRVPDYRLRIAPLPASWASSLRLLVPTLGTQAYEKAVFPAVRHELEGRRDELLTPPAAPLHHDPLAAHCPLLDGPAASLTASAAAAVTPIYDLESTPEFQDLQTWLADLSDLQVHLAIYNRFEGTGTCLVDEDTTLNLFGALTRYTFDRTIQPPTVEARDFYGQVLCDVRPAPVLDLNRYQSRIDEQLDARFSATLEKLFYENVVTRDLEDLQACIDHLAFSYLPEEEAAQFYSGLVGLIDRTRRDLNRPRVGWIGSPEVALGTPYQQLLRTVAAPTFTSKDTVQEMAVTATDAYLDYRDWLKRLSTRPTGPLLAQEGGDLVLRLSPQVLGLRAALSSLVTTYLGPTEELAWREEPPPGTWLWWDSGQLAEAAQYLGGYDSFVGSDLGQYPGLQAVVTSTTREKVERDVLDMAARGQLFPPEPAFVRPDTREAHLAQQVASLQAAAEPLKQLMALFRQPAGNACATDPGLPFCRIARTVAGQQTRLLGELDDLYRALRLYHPARGGFATWEGDGNLAWSTFGVDGEARLAAFVAAQRSAVTRLASEYAAPVLTAVPVPRSLRRTDPAVVVRWQTMLSDVQAYQDGTPDNPLARLEGFITTTMATATPEDCLEVSIGEVACTTEAVRPTADDGAVVCDPLVVARSRLVLGTVARCEGVVLDQGTRAWDRVSVAFADRLDERYPFTREPFRIDGPEPASGGAPGGPDAATPDQVARFFDDYDAARPALSRLSRVYERRRGSSPSSSIALLAEAPDLPDWPALPWSRESEAEVAAFLADMDRVRDFFAPYLAARAAALAKDPEGPVPPPQFHLASELRPRPRSERGGDGVIRRTLSIDRRPASREGPVPLVPDGPLTWSYGAPLHLTLDWAKDGPHLPRPGRSTAHVEGPTVSWAFPTPWSLLHLLRGPRRDGLLEVVVPTVEAPREELPCRNARPCGIGGAPPPVPPAVPVSLLIRVTVLDPTDADRTVPVPSFPTATPRVVAALPGTAARGSH